MIAETKENCTGCYACFNSCPKNCIVMEYDEEGFVYPKIDNSICIHCHKCEEHCFILHKKINKGEKVSYAALALDDEVRIVSSSGGIFSLFAKEVLKSGGVVYGAAFNRNYIVEHKKITLIKELGELQGSKYVQSEIGDTYSEIQEELNSGKLVYFSGTPCQVNGLNSFLRKDYNNLICQDIVCHGVPSKKMWLHYLKQFEIQNDTKISFRDKTTGWESYSFMIRQKNKCFKQLAYDNMYLRSFTRNFTLRPSCYACKSKGINRQSDITLGDFWGIKNVCPEMYDNQGVSLVIINSDKGQRLFNQIAGNMRFKLTDFNKSIKENPAYSISAERPENREQFIQEIFKERYNKVAFKYMKDPLDLRIKIRISRWLNKIKK